MIEIPAIALIADLAAEEVDFASIGSNDLTQYLSAADRMNPEVAAYLQKRFYGNASATWVCIPGVFQTGKGDICLRRNGRKSGDRPIAGGTGSEKAVYEQWKYRRCKGKTG